MVIGSIHMLWLFVWFKATNITGVIPRYFIVSGSDPSDGLPATLGEDHQPLSAQKVHVGAPTSRDGK